MGPRRWGGTQDPGPCGGTMGWDFGVGPWGGTLGRHPGVGPWGRTLWWDPGVRPWGGTMGWDYGWNLGVGPWVGTLGWNILYTLWLYDISKYIKDTHSTTSSTLLFLRREFLPLPITRNLCWARDRTFVPQYYLNGLKYPILILATDFILLEINEHNNRNTQIIGILEQNSSTTKNIVPQSNMTEMFNFYQMSGVISSPELNALTNQGWYNQPIVSTPSVLPYQGFALKWVNGTTVTTCYGCGVEIPNPPKITIRRASYCVAWLPGI